MEFPFDINQIFSERVSILDQSLVAGRRSAGRPDLQAHIATVIDEVGRASAKAQQLTAPITSASKMQSQRHQLYLLKDGESSGGRVVVVGFLKVGYKKLFLLDRQGVHIEAEPLCVLDFYIAENLQRHGYGLELFDFMLQVLNPVDSNPGLSLDESPQNSRDAPPLGRDITVTKTIGEAHKTLPPAKPKEVLQATAKAVVIAGLIPHEHPVMYGGKSVSMGGCYTLTYSIKTLYFEHKNLEPVLMAYDRPSPKFLSFLAKHYCLTQSVPQVNNFVVFEGFFLNRSAAQLRKVPLKKPDGEIKPYSLMEREVVRQEQRTRPWPFAPPHSPQRSVSSQCSRSLSVRSSPSRLPPQVVLPSSPGGSRNQNPQSPLIDRCRERRSSQQGLAARCSLYSRHMDSRAVGLLDRPLPGLRAVGDQSYALGHTDTHRLARIHKPQIRCQPLSLSLLCASKTDGFCSQTSIDSREMSLDTDSEACRVEEETEVLDCLQHPAGGNQRSELEKESDGQRRGWSWTVGEICSTAQWVKQKQEYRSTRPW